MKWSSPHSQQKSLTWQRFSLVSSWINKHVWYYLIYIKYTKHRYKPIMKHESQSESRSVMSNSLGFHGTLQARILEWVAFPFSKGSSQPRNWTGVSCITGGFFTNWAIKESPKWSISTITEFYLSASTYHIQILKINIIYISIKVL